MGRVWVGQGTVFLMNLLFICPLSVDDLQPELVPEFIVFFLEA